MEAMVGALLAWLLIGAGAIGARPERDQADPRDVVRSGVQISHNRSQYYNQPQAVQLLNGSWLLVITNAPFTEGDPRQRVVSILHPSPDLREGGWLPPVEIEGPGLGDRGSAGWVVPLLAPALRRVFAFYTYNADNITTVPTAGAANVSCRCNLVGGQWFRYSDTWGASWSQRYRIPIRATSIDRGNPWNGTQLQGWTVSKPIATRSGSVVMPFTKVGTYLQGHDRYAAQRSRPAEHVM